MRTVFNDVQITCCIRFTWFKNSVVDSLETFLKFSSSISQSLIAKSSRVES